LVNNAGVNTRGYFKDLTSEQVREMALVNTYPYTLLTKALLPHLNKCSERSLILNICSTISYGPSAYDALYAATKVFEVFTFESLRRELNASFKKKFDMLTMNPQYVSTNNARLTPGGLVDTAEKFA
jgi:short-subunit dehydrogenase